MPDLDVALLAAAASYDILKDRYILPARAFTMILRLSFFKF
jgi:hypothetical protein